MKIETIEQFDEFTKEYRSKNGEPTYLVFRITRYKAPKGFFARLFQKDIVQTTAPDITYLYRQNIDSVDKIKYEIRLAYDILNKNNGIQKFEWLEKYQIDDICDDIKNKNTTLDTLLKQKYTDKIKAIQNDLRFTKEYKKNAIANIENDEEFRLLKSLVDIQKTEEYQERLKSLKYTSYNVIYLSI